MGSVLLTFADSIEMCGGWVAPGDVDYRVDGAWQLCQDKRPMDDRVSLRADAVRKGQVEALFDAIMLT